MKYPILISLCIALALASCRKKQQTPPPAAGCISVNYKWHNSKLPISDSVTAAEMLRRNKIYSWQYVPDSIRFSMVGSDSLCVVVARSIRGGLPQFEEFAKFYFINSSLDSMHPIINSLNAAVVQDIRPRTDIQFVSRRFFDVVTKIESSTCLEAQFGYLNEQTVAGVVTQRCWRVTPAGSEVPVVYITDDGVGRVVRYKD